MSLVREKANLFLVYVLAGSSIFLKIYRAEASILTGVNVGSPAPYTVQDYGSGEVRGVLQGQVVLHPLTVLQADQAKKYRALYEKFPAWKIEVESENPGGEFNFKRYEACPKDELPTSTNPSPTVSCPLTIAEVNSVAPNLSVPAKQTSTIGSVTIFEFIPDGGNFSKQNGSFIQIIRNSYSSDCNGKYETLKIDNLLPCPKSSPLYWYEFNSSVFLDRTEDPFFYGGLNNVDEYFDAEVFAASVEGKRLRLYDGVSWGWRSKIKITPAPPAKPLSALPPSPDPSRTARRPPCPAGMPIHSCIIFGYDYGGNGYAQVPLTEIAPSQSDPTNTNPVPTPALLPSLIATGIYHGKKWRKRKKQQTDRTAA
jgi:hypothetical protein